MLRKAVATVWALRRSFPMYRIFMQSDEVEERCVNSLSARWQFPYTQQFLLRLPPAPCTSKRCRLAFRTPTPGVFFPTFISLTCRRPCRTRGRRATVWALWRKRERKCRGAGMGRGNMQWTAHSGWDHPDARSGKVLLERSRDWHHVVDHRFDCLGEGTPRSVPGLVADPWRGQPV